MKIFIILPIILLILFIILAPKNNRIVSIIQKIFIVLIIIFYSIKNINYGVFICIAVIFYFYLSDTLREGFNEKSNYTNEKAVDEAVGLKSENKIPKIIIQTWKTNDVPIKYKNMVDSIKTMNPDFEYKFFSDHDIEKFLKDNYPDYYITYSRLPIKIQKIDFFRYVAIYHYGGFYFDLDMNSLEPLDDSVLNNKCVFPVDEIINRDMCKQQRYSDFCNNNMFFLLGQYAFGAKAKDPFIKLLVDSIHTNINEIVQKYNSTLNKEIYVYSTTGPDFVSKLYIDYAHQYEVKILHNNTRQYFGKYAQHNYFGTWK